MLYFLYGSDTFRLQRKLAEIKKRFFAVNKAGFNLEEIGCQFLGFKDFWDNFSQVSMFVSNKLFFLENVFSNDEFKKKFAEKAEEINNSRDVVAVVEKKDVKKTDKLFLALSGLAKCQEFDFLGGQKLKNWVIKEFDSFGASISDAGLKKIILLAGGDLWQMENEIKKLSAYTKQVEEEEVDFFVRRKLSAEIFTTIDCLAEKNKKQAFYHLQSHLENGDSPFYLLSMVAYQFRNLLAVKSCSAGSVQKLGLHPYVLRKTLGQVSRFSLLELKKACHKILMADLSIKTGRISPEEALRQLIAEL